MVFLTHSLTVAAIFAGLQESAGLLSHRSSTSSAFGTRWPQNALPGSRSRHSAPLRMVATPEKKEKKLAKIEKIKIDSEQLREPLRTEMKNDEIFVSQMLTRFSTPRILPAR